MKQQKAETNKYNIVAHDSFITFADEDTTVTLKDDEGYDYIIKFIFTPDDKDSSEIKIKSEIMDNGGISGTIFKITNANSSLDAGISSPYLFAEKTVTSTTGGKSIDKIYSYFINIWTRKMASSRMITYTIYLSKNPK